MAKDRRADAVHSQQERIARALRAGPDAPPESETDPGHHGPTMEQRAAIVETAIQQAIRRGDFDNLPGAGKPLEGLGSAHDPDWWIRRKIQREQLSGLGPPALMLRVEHAELNDRLDRMFSENEVRAALADFNARVVEARRQLLGGPPVVTPLREVEAEVTAWRERRARRELTARREREQASEREAQAKPARRRRFLGKSKRR